MAVFAASLRHRWKPVPVPPVPFHPAPSPSQLLEAFLKFLFFR